MPYRTERIQGSQRGRAASLPSFRREGNQPTREPEGEENLRLPLPDTNLETITLSKSNGTHAWCKTSHQWICISRSFWYGDDCVSINDIVVFVGETTDKKRVSPCQSIDIYISVNHRPGPVILHPRCTYPSKLLCFFSAVIGSQCDYYTAIKQSIGRPRY